MAKWNVFGNQTDPDKPAPFLGQVTTEIADRGRATELAKRKHGEKVSHVVRESHLENVKGKLTKRDE